VRELAGVRQRSEEYERASLSTWATLAIETKGRDRYEEPDALRTAFQQDRDRILRSAGFARLAGAPLRSTLSVSHLARSAGRALRLNEDLIEAIALGVQVGRPPFGSAGVDALSSFADGFTAPEHALRVVEVLERGGRGLNLTWETRDGILHAAWEGDIPSTLEGQVVRLACAMDGAAADPVPRDVADALGATPARRIAALVEDVVVGSLDRPEARLSRPVDRALAVLRDDAATARALPAARAAHLRAVHCVESLAVFFLENRDQLPASAADGVTLEQRVVDAIAAYSDAEALATFRRLFEPQV
jgi:dGTPase